MKDRSQKKEISWKDKVSEHYRDRLEDHSRAFAEFDWPSAELGLNLSRTYERVRGELAKKIEAHGLSFAAFNVLIILGRCDQAGSPMHEIGELLLVTRANVTGLVDLLVKKGLVERTENESDRRVRIVRITDEGTRLLMTLLCAHYSFMRELFSGLTDEEKSQLNRLVLKLGQSVENSVTERLCKKQQ